MKVLIKNATIHSPSSPLHGTVNDIFIENGLIASIGKNLSFDADTTIDHLDLHVSIGWMDCFANFCDPGEEYKETLETGASAAAAGGFTEVMLIPNTHPFVSDKSQVEYLIQKGKSLPVTIRPIGSITKKTEGKELCEMYDMYNTGAVAFSDGLNPIQSSGVLQKALEYLLTIDATVIQLPDDKSIGTHGLINEGIISTRAGLPGKPALAEELMIARDIELARYTGSKIHFTGVSTSKSLELIAAAKAEGLNITCSVTPYHLYFCDEDLEGYDTNLKVNPPIRSVKDRDALRKGVLEGVVDFIASHHQPQDYDHKVCEFEYAKYGMEGLESVFSAMEPCGIPADIFVRMQTENVRSIFNLPIPEFKEGAKASLTFYVPGLEYTFSEKNIFSKCRNNAFVGKELRGKVIGIFNADQLFLSDNFIITK